MERVGQYALIESTGFHLLYCQLIFHAVDGATLMSGYRCSMSLGHT